MMNDPALPLPDAVEPHDARQTTAVNRFDALFAEYLHTWFSLHAEHLLDQVGAHLFYGGSGSDWHTALSQRGDALRPFAAEYAGLVREVDSYLLGGDSSAARIQEFSMRAVDLLDRGVPLLERAINDHRRRGTKVNGPIDANIVDFRNEVRQTVDQLRGFNPSGLDRGKIDAELILRFVATCGGDPQSGLQGTLDCHGMPLSQVLFVALQGFRRLRDAVYQVVKDRLLGCGELFAMNPAEVETDPRYQALCEALFTPTTIPVSVDRRGRLIISMSFDSWFVDAVDRCAKEAASVYQLVADRTRGVASPLNVTAIDDNVHVSVAFNLGVSDLLPYSPPAQRWSRAPMEQIEFWFTRSLPDSNGAIREVTCKGTGMLLATADARSQFWRAMKVMDRLIAAHPQFHTFHLDPLGQGWDVQLQDQTDRGGISVSLRGELSGGTPSPKLVDLKQGYFYRKARAADVIGWGAREIPYGGRDHVQLRIDGPLAGFSDAKLQAALDSFLGVIEPMNLPPLSATRRGDRDPAKMLEDLERVAREIRYRRGLTGRLAVKAVSQAETGTFRHVQFFEVVNDQLLLVATGERTGPGNSIQYQMRDATVIAEIWSTLETVIEDTFHRREGRIPSNSLLSRELRQRMVIVSDRFLAQIFREFRAPEATCREYLTPRLREAFDWFCADPAVITERRGTNRIMLRSDELHQVDED